MSNWAENLKLTERTPYLNIKAGESKTVKFLNDEPNEYIDKGFGANKISFLVEYEGNNYFLDFNKKLYTLMRQLKELYPITNKRCKISRTGEKTQTRYELVLVE